MFEFSKIEFLDWLNIKCKENEHFFFQDYYVLLEADGFIKKTKIFLY